MRAMTYATVFVAAAGYLVIWVASKALPKAGYEDFMVYWSMFFALTGVLDGLMQETARAVTTRRELGGPAVPHTRTAAPFRISAIVAAVIAIIMAATGPLWVDQIVPSMPGWGVGLMAIGLASYTFQAVVCGLLSAANAWGMFAWLIAIDSGVRLVLAAVAWAVGWHVLAFLIVTVLGALTWLFILLVSGQARELLPERADVAINAFLSRAGKAMIAAGANAILITGFTVLLRYTSASDVPPGALAATITAVTLTRAPILVPLQRFQPALIVHFTKHRNHVLRAAALPIGAVAGVAVVGGLAAWAIAAPLMGIFFDADLIAPPATLGLLTVASGATAILMISGSAALAADRHNLYTTGWLVATAVTIGILTINASADTRAILALGIGPLIGAVVQLGLLSFLPTPDYAGTGSDRSDRFDRPDTPADTTSFPDKV